MIITCYFDVPFRRPLRVNGAKRSEEAHKATGIAFHVAETLHFVQGDNAFSSFHVVFKARFKIIRTSLPGAVVAIAHTGRDEMTRLVSVRKATKYEERTYFEYLAN